jgi:hypothetical protein
MAASIAYGLAVPKWNRFRQLAARQKGQVDIVDQLAKLAKLHADGVLTDEEFKSLKNNLLEPMTLNDGTLRPKIDREIAH